MSVIHHIQYLRTSLAYVMYQIIQLQRIPADKSEWIKQQRSATNPVHDL